MSSLKYVRRKCVCLKNVPSKICPSEKRRGPKNRQLKDELMGSTLRVKICHRLKIKNLKKLNLNILETKPFFYAEFALVLSILVSDCLLFVNAN